MARLILLTGPQTGREVEIDRPEFVIGREAGCALVVDDGTVSRRHALIARAPDGFHVRDLGSRNGLRVQGRRVSEAPLSHGDLIHVGSVQMRFIADAAAEPKTPPASAPDHVPRRARLDMPAILLGVGILAALGLLFAVLREPDPLAVEVIPLAVDQEVYHSLEGTIRRIEPAVPAGVVEFEAEPGESSIVFVGVEEGQADLWVETEAGKRLLRLQVGPRPPPRRRPNLTPEGAVPLAEQLLSEGDAAFSEEALLRVAVQKYEEALDILSQVPGREDFWTLAKQKRDAARRKMRAARREHESRYVLAAYQRDIVRAREEALWILNTIDPVEDGVSYQRWTERLAKLGVPAARIPLELERLRRRVFR